MDRVIRQVPWLKSYGGFADPGLEQVEHPAQFAGITRAIAVKQEQKGRGAVAPGPGNGRDEYLVQAGRRRVGLLAKERLHDGGQDGGAANPFALWLVCLAGLESALLIPGHCYRLLDAEEPLLAHRSQRLA
jgi:hypothetical protein